MSARPRGFHTLRPCARLCAQERGFAKRAVMEVRPPPPSGHPEAAHTSLGVFCMSRRNPNFEPVRVDGVT